MNDSALSMNDSAIYMHRYMILLCCAIVLHVVLCEVINFVTVVAARRLHNKMFDIVLGAKSCFFDENPVGTRAYALFKLFVDAYLHICLFVCVRACVSVCVRVFVLREGLCARVCMRAPVFVCSAIIVLTSINT
jgi:hypothetical protein